MKSLALPEECHSASCRRGSSNNGPASAGGSRPQRLVCHAARTQPLPRPDSAHEQDALNRLNTPTSTSREQRSTLQQMVDRSLQQDPNKRQARQSHVPPGAPQPHPWASDGRQRQLRITGDKPAGQLAGALAGMLRTHNCADLTFSSVLSIFKCLKVLALANIFMDQHQSSCSFVFSSVSEAEHQARVQQLIHNHRHMQEMKLQQQHQPQQQQQHEHDPRRDAGAMPGVRKQQQHRQWEQRQQQQWQQPQPGDAPGQAPEPVPAMPVSAFKLHAWITPHPNGSEPGSSGGKVQVQMLDFSLDMRQMWRRMAYLSFDTAMSIADTLYARLVAQLPLEQHYPQQPHLDPSVNPATYGANGAAAPAALGTAAAAAQAGAAQPAAGAWQPAGRAVGSAAAPPGEQPLPTLMCGTDLSQGVLIFAALSFVQQRLSLAGHTHMLVVTVMRHGPNHPRLDGRNGFMLKLQLQPGRVVAGHLRRARTWKRTGAAARQQPQGTAARQPTAAAPPPAAWA